MSKIEQLRTAQANAAKALKQHGAAIPGDNASASEQDNWQAEWDRRDKTYIEAKAATTAEEARIAKGAVVNSRINAVDRDGRNETLLIGRDGGRMFDTSTQRYDGGSSTAGHSGMNPRAYRELFHSLPLDNGGFNTPNEFFRIVGRNSHDPRIYNLQHGEYSDPYGGFAVPTQFAAEILDTALEGEIVRPRARVVPLATDELKIPRWDGTDHSSGTLFGGLQAAWTAEGDSPGTSKGRLERMTLRPGRLFIYTTSSNQLLEDSPAFRNGLMSAIGGTIGFKLDEAFLTGSGVGKPLGIINDPALISISGEEGQAADTILYSNLAKMFARMYPAGRTRAAWVCNNAAIPQLLELTIPVGTGGTHIPVMTRGPEGFDILGRPVLFTEKLPTLGTSGDILFVDFSQYVIGLRHDVRLDSSQDVLFATDETAFRSIVRADGRGTWREPITPVAGDTLSWCVAIETRD